MSTKKKMSPPKKVTSTKSKKPSTPKKVTPKKTAPKTAAVKKIVIKKISLSSLESFEDAVTKEALKLVDEAAGLLRAGIKTSQKTTSKAREATHKKAHSLLGKATNHLDNAIKSGSSYLRKAISKI
ncbi:MAG: hypothetical protein NT164_00855 [Verrucomicrobiae bacterium]|nr:hypothetical protein [Verrucomicrobiae bacterium]